MGGLCFDSFRSSQNNVLHVLRNSIRSTCGNGGIHCTCGLQLTCGDCSTRGEHCGCCARGEDSFLHSSTHGCRSSAGGSDSFLHYTCDNIRSSSTCSDHSGLLCTTGFHRFVWREWLLLRRCSFSGQSITRVQQPYH